MTTDILVDVGEEYVIKNNVDGATFTFGLYDDSTDSLSDSSEVGDITTEPENANYSTQSVTVSAANLAGNWGVENDGSFSFDFSDVEPGDSEVQDVDAAYVTVNFTSDELGQESDTDNLIGNFALEQTRDIGSLDAIEVGAGDATLTLD